MRNPALKTKVKALKGNLLTDIDYLRLIDTDTLSEVIRYLKENTHFSSYLKDINEDESRTVLEEIFKNLIVDDSKKILFFINGDERDFIKLVKEKVNLDSFLVLIRALAKNMNLDEILSYLVFSSEYSKQAIKNFSDSPSFETLKNLLKNSIFYRALETYSVLNSNNLFEIEKTMERSYYDQVFKTIKNLNSKYNESLVKCIRTEIDLLNLIWIYRTKKFYHLNVDQIIPYIYRGGLKVSEEELYRLAEIDDYHELLEELKKFKEYSFLFEHSEKDLDLHMNRRRKRYMYYKYRDLFFFGDAISSAYAYLQLLDFEISDIITIIEAKRYNLSNKETIQYLIKNIDE